MGICPALSWRGLYLLCQKSAPPQFQGDIFSQGKVAIGYATQGHSHDKWLLLYIWNKVETSLNTKAKHFS